MTSMENPKPEAGVDFKRESIAWFNLNVYSKADSGVPFVKKPKPAIQIIKNVSGELKSGQTMAIMGSSGAGKTTLLNVLTARNLGNFTVDGVVKISGQVADVDMITSISAYVQQLDLFVPTLSVREHLIFQSLVRMEQALSDEYKLKRIQDVMSELSLLKCADTWVGGNTYFKGISGGEMKRLSFAVEILTNPSIMFCDEPTSGLDSFMAASLVQYVDRMAQAGRTIICTIHQPASEVFNIFKNLLLMADGRVAYMGELQGALVYFSQLGMKCPVNFNPADFYVSEMAVIPTRDIECKKKINRICDYFEKIKPKSDDGKRQSSFINKKENMSRYKASTFLQYQALAWRSCLMTLREPILTYVRLGQAIAIAFVIGLVYFHTYYDQRGVMNLNGALFLIIVNLTIQNAFAVINTFCNEISIFVREHNNGMYRVDAYFMMKNLAEVPVFVLIPVFNTSIYYFMVGFYPSADAYLYLMMIGILISSCGVSFGYLISCLCGNTDVALSFGPPLLVPLQLMGGFFLNTLTVPVYLVWIKYISWFYYGYNLITTNQWENVGSLECTKLTPRRTTYTATSLTTTTQSFLSTILPPKNESKPSMCYKDGNDVLTFLGMGDDNPVVDIACICILIICMRGCAYAALFWRASQR